MERHSLTDLHYTDNRIATIEHWCPYEHVYTYICISIFGICVIRKSDKSEGFGHKNSLHVCIIYIYIIYYRHSALGPVWAETRAQSGDWYSSGTLHP
jgi:hypothetical protein